jgi:hypothetical protein
MTMKTVSVLFVADDSIYKTMPECDCYDMARDARNYAGTLPVIAHPPCRTWSCLKHFATAAPADEHALGPWAVEQVRRCGGVLEHPAGSSLFAECGCGAAGDVGFVVAVNQFDWGHRASKPTKLYVVGCSLAELPQAPLRLAYPTHCISQSHGARIGNRIFKPRVSNRERSATPPAFARWLVELAGKCATA